MRRILARSSDYLDLGCQWLATGFFGAMLILVIFQVVTRYLLQNAPVWTEELARYCMVWGGLLGATVAFKEGSDPCLVPPPTRGNHIWVSGARILRAIATVAFLGPILYHSDKFLLRTWQRTTEALGIPTAFVTVAVPLAVAVIFFHLLAQMLGKPGASEGQAESAMDTSV
ncbi:MAG: TRAP transporter small permease [Syntrophobacteraceae bacterium]|nr:TRAP transporter small permease [Syntrophobacteraceae bacterium]